MRASDSPPTPPTHAVLHEAALAYLGRRPATAALLARVLGRRVTTWASRARRAGTAGEEIAEQSEQARAAIGAIVARFVEVGLVNDASFAASRAEKLARAGRSSRAIAAYLAAKGVDGATVRGAATRGADAELAAAVALTRRRRLGPFSRDVMTNETDKRKQLAVLARAGFERHVAERALRLDRDEAEAVLRSM
jgi:regulatory protein